MITSPVFTAVAVGAPLKGERVIQIREAARQINPAIQYAFILVDHTVEDSGRLQIAALRATDFQPMPVPQSVLYDGRTPACRDGNGSLFRHLVRFLGEGEDPFDVREPVFDVLNFFGREALAESLAERLGEGGRYGVFGLRKMGKSSLMRYTAGKLPFPTAWLSLQQSVLPESVYERILRRDGDARTRFGVSLEVDPARVKAGEPDGPSWTRRNMPSGCWADCDRRHTWRSSSMRSSSSNRAPAPPNPTSIVPLPSSGCSVASLRKTAGCP